MKRQRYLFSGSIVVARAVGAPTKACKLQGRPLSEAGHWLQLLAVADLVYVVVGLLTFEFILDA